MIFLFSFLCTHSVYSILHFTDCKPYLLEPNIKQSIACGILLEAVARSSPIAAKSVLDLSLSLLLQDFYLHTRVCKCDYLIDDASLILCVEW
jgi:hypothetical protein